MEFLEDKNDVVVVNDKVVIIDWVGLGATILMVYMQSGNTLLCIVDND